MFTLSLFFFLLFSASRSHALDLGFVLLGGENEVNSSLNMLNNVDAFYVQGETSYEWITLPSLLTPRGANPAAGFVCNESGYYFFVAGGGSASGNVVLDTAEMYDGSSKTWQVIQSMSIGRAYVSGAMMPDGTTFLVTAGQYGYSTTLATCEGLDTVTGEWLTFPEVQQARSDHTTILFDNAMVVLGGGYNANSTYFVINSCEYLLPESSSWTSFPSFHFPRSDFGAAVAQQKIYIAGGYGGDALDSVEVFSGDSWTVLSSTLSVPRNGCAATAFRGSFVVVGGNSSTFDVYEPMNDNWISLPVASAPESRGFLAVLTIYS